MEQCFDPERLRPAALVCQPDPRNTGLVKVDRISGTIESFNLDDQHEAIAELTLNTSVPADITWQFETARNLYLYAWFVYRFYNVAEQHSLACLELALRDRLKAEIDAGSRRTRLQSVQAGSPPKGFASILSRASCCSKGMLSTRQST